MIPWDELPLTPELIALDLAQVCFPRQRPPMLAGRIDSREASMYTLNKAKEEIDAVAKHASDIAVHALAIVGELDAKLDTFKSDILSAIDAKFAELARSIRGEGEPAETSAIADLGAKVSLLTRTAAPPADQPSSGDEHHAPGDPEWHQGPAPESNGHHQDNHENPEHHEHY